MTKWQNKTYPDGCRHCGTTERVSLGRGLCSKCYQDNEIKELYAPIRKGTGDVEFDSANATDFVAFVEADPNDPVLDNGGLVESENENVEGLGFESAGERRPGAAFVTDGAGPTPGTDELKGFRKLFGKKAKPQEAPSTKERRPKVPKGPGRRVSAADSLSDAWAGIGGIAARTGHLPLGRCLQFQAPVAGEMLDEALKGSFVDKRFLQPIVKTRGRFDLLGAVFGPPLLVLAIERNPERAELILPMLKSSIRSSLPLMVPAIKKVQEKERKAAEAARELFPDLPEGEDPADAIIALMFSDWVPQAPEPETQEAPIFEDETV